ncbi:DUF3085 domain-containing protein [Erwinia persicina]|uniref:DUF3085 domain-containing protein n=1 Tax=Erwinia persicina TaxID=55211 RepID=UPI00210D2B65|nr:DUF3085 domain-containing protein [Erwinia persicina]MCQ4094999.1 DUF3085 domain-containing protein [Erwinia persicina]MCQ4100036.1 DUF3085 domain-containing protein [Erwinia persicina]
MIRFTSASLRQALTIPASFDNPLTIENGYGLYIRVEDDKRPGYWHMAYAEGCNPKTDEDWEARVLELSPVFDYSFRFFISYLVRDSILDEHHDFIVTPKVDTVHSEAQPPVKVFVPVADFRNGIERMFDQSHKHFHACVGDRERAAWRLSALYVLDDVIRTDCKRAKTADREQFVRAFARLKDRISTISQEGKIILPAFLR